MKGRKSKKREIVKHGARPTSGEVLAKVAIERLKKIDERGVRHFLGILNYALEERADLREHPRVTEIFETLMKRQDLGIVFKMELVSSSLGHLQGQKSQDLLIKIATNPKEDINVRRETARVVAQHGDRRIIAPLKTAMMRAAIELGKFAEKMKTTKNPTQADDRMAFQLQHKFYFLRDAYVAACKRHGIEPEEIRTRWE